MFQWIMLQLDEYTSLVSKNKELDILLDNIRSVKIEVELNRWNLLDIWYKGINELLNLIDILKWSVLQKSIKAETIWDIKYRNGSLDILWILEKELININETIKKKEQKIRKEQEEIDKKLKK